MFRAFYIIIAVWIVASWVSPYLYVLASWKNEAIIAIINIGVLSPDAIGAIVTALSLSLYFKIISLF